MLFLFLLALAIAVVALKRHRDIRARLVRTGRFLLEYLLVLTGARPPAPGFVQRAVHEAVLAQCTVAVNGAVRLPSSIEVLLSPEAAELAALFGKRFTADIVDAVLAEAVRSGWELEA